MTPDDYCKVKAASSGSPVYHPFLFLPPERRGAITAPTPGRRAAATPAG